MKAGDFIKGYHVRRQERKGMSNKCHFLWRIDEISNGGIEGKSFVLADSPNIKLGQVSEGWEFHLNVSVSDVEKLISNNQAEIIII